MLRWTSKFCSQVKLLMKLDDDSFLIPSRMAKWLNHFETSQSWPRNSVIGEYHSCYKTHSTLAQIPTINPDISGGSGHSQVQYDMELSADCPAGMAWYDIKLLKMVRFSLKLCSSACTCTCCPNSSKIRYMKYIYVEQQEQNVVLPLY